MKLDKMLSKIMNLGMLIIALSVFNNSLPTLITGLALSTGAGFGYLFAGLRLGIKGSNE